MVFCVVAGSLLGLGGRYLEYRRQVRKAEMSRFVRQLSLELGAHWPPRYSRQEEILTWPDDFDVPVELQKPKCESDP